jgi:hypothetical protein
MEQETKYTTSDLYLAAFLKLKGNKMSIDKNRNKVFFCFDKTDDLTKNVNDYLSEGGSCEPLLYTNSIKNLKNLLYNL